jgi:NADH-quinone oxidoreductase subunit K
MTLSHYLLVSGVLFSIGLFGVLVRRNLLIIFMCLEMMLAAASLTLVAFSRFRLENGLPSTDAQTMVFFVITVAAAEVAVGLAIIVALYRTKQTVDVSDLDSLKG